MVTNEELQRQADNHAIGAEIAEAQRKKFEYGEIYSCSGVYSADHDIWVKDAVALFSTLAADHRRIRDSLLSQLQND
jgi:outer membrane protein assembly factor BamB